MKDEKERSVASAGSVAERPLGDPEIAVEVLRLRVAELEEAIRRLAEQDATLSACNGNVTVTMDAAFTDAEREALAFAYDMLCQRARELQAVHAVESSRRCVEASRALQGLFEKIGGRQ